MIPRLRDRLAGVVGGTARLRVIVLLAAVLSLTSADVATVGALATQLRDSLRISDTELGLLVTASSGVGVLTTLPFGILADRANRVRVLLVSIGLWSAAMVASGFAQSFSWLLLSRLALGAVVAAAGPLVASLTGDYFAATERGRIYGFILAGEIVGAGFGIIVPGDIGAILGWRTAFFLLAVLGLGLGAVIARQLAEPARGGQSRLPIESDSGAGGPAWDSESGGPAKGADGAPPGLSPALSQAVRRAKVSPHEHLILRSDPTDRSLWWAVKYVLSIRTNVVMIIASALGNFFFAGIQTFGVEFAKGRYSLSQGFASGLLLLIGAGALAGTLVSGRVSDALIARHHISVRPVVAGLAFLVAIVSFAPALLSRSWLLATPLFMAAAAGIGATNPPLDAARLDIVHFRLWGRAESVRTVLRHALAASAPLVFGFVSTKLGGAGGGFGGASQLQPHGALGLDRAFLVMLVPLLAACLLLLIVARRTYPRDVATTLASHIAPTG